MTENVNGIQVDVSKYVGEEIARLAVASIDEDRLDRLAEKAIRDLYEINGLRVNVLLRYTEWLHSFLERKSKSMSLIFWSVTISKSRLEDKLNRLSRTCRKEFAKLSLSSTRMPWLGTLLPDILAGRSK